MTKLPRTHGRIVVVGQFPGSVNVDLRQILWRELKLLGVRNYEAEDFEKAISLVSKRALPLERLISEVRPLNQIQTTFQEIEKGANFMKVLFKCSD